jgi:hypothetical protein
MQTLSFRTELGNEVDAMAAATCTPNSVSGEKMLSFAIILARLWSENSVYGGSDARQTARAAAPNKEALLFLRGLRTRDEFGFGLGESC